MHHHLHEEAAVGEVGAGAQHVDLHVAAFRASSAGESTTGAANWRFGVRGIHLFGGEGGKRVAEQNVAR